MKRKLFCLCLILGILMSFSITVSAKSFDDTEGHWAEESITEWSGNGILNGIGNNKFNPDGYMTRTEAAAVFSRLLALNERANISDFKDVESNAWYAESLEKCVAAGILNGDGSNMNPGGYITREMFFTMFGRAFNIQPENTLTKEFSDADEISSWAQGYTYAFINQGYVNGVTKDTVAPKNNIDRASVITLLDRLIANYAVQDNDVLQSADKGISLVVANNCTVADGFSGTVVISGDDIKISFKGASVNTKIIVKADNAVITDVPEGVTVSVVKGAENVEVNGKQVEDDTTFTATVEKVEEKKPTVVGGGGGHSHRYTGNETTKATCTEDGVMTYTCRCGRSYTEVIPKLSENDEHTPAEPVKENETETTYDEVVYCSVCTVEISRTQKSNVSCTEHIPGTPVKENEVAGDCETPATYEEVVYCSVCGTHEISRTPKTGELGDHVSGTPVKENEVAGNCQTPATYEEVVYCSVCGTHEISRTSKTGELGNHTPGTPVKENEVAGNCQTPATYDEVVYCSVCGAHEISRTSKTGELGNHTPGTPVKENEVAGNCQTPATYEEVVYCSVCGTHEISRTSKTGVFGDHTPGTPVKENEVTGTCQTPATYDEVVYCSVCGTHEISRTPRNGELGDHTPGTPVKENEVAGNCQTPATYDEVVYCSVCGTHEISRTQKTGELGDHTPGTPVRENEVAGNCQTPATYDEVVYCSVCGTHEISREQKTTGYGDHSPAEAVKENIVASSCDSAGTYDEVIYCSICGDELSREEKTTDVIGHTPGTPVKENEVAGNCQTPATYDEVIYCSVCGTHEISRTQETGALGNHTPGTPVKENEVAGNCQTPATYDEVVYCSVCGTHEISRTQKTSGYGDHVAATPVTENVVAGTCVVEGTYDEVVYCSVCATHEISRTPKTGELGNHTPGTPVRENEVAGNCKVEGTYDEVIYCSVCNTHEISRRNKTSGYGEHIPGTPLRENEVSGNCETPTTYEEVIYCSVCGTHEISRTQKTGELGDHSPKNAVRENETDGNCETKAIWDEVVYCSICEDELSRTQKTGEFGDHTPKAAVKENEVAGNCQTAGTYDEVVYCDVCGDELSKTPKTGALGDHNFVGGSCEHCGEPEIITEPTIKIENVTAYAGQSVDVTVSVVNNPGISSLKVLVEYDERLVLETVSFTSLFGSYITAPTPYTNPQAISMMSPMSDINSDGVFATLTFNVSELNNGDIAKIKLTYDQGNTFDSNFSNVVFNVIDGEIVYSNVCERHIPKAPVIENEMLGNCKIKATWDEVLYCNVCGDEISRTPKTGDFGDHNFVGGSCERCGEPDTGHGTEPSIGLEIESNGDGTCCVISMGDCTDTDVVIPEYFNGDKVTSIDSNAFAGESIMSITIPASIEEIGRRAFNNCDELTDVYFNGSEEEWNTIDINATGNTALTNANIHFAKQEITYDGATIVVEKVTVGTGDTVDVKLSVANNPGISSLKVFVEYNGKLVLENVSFTSLFGSYITAPTPYENPQAISMMSPMADISDDGVFAILTFNVSALQSGETANVSLTYDQGNTFNGEFENIIFNISNGSIKK